MAIYCWSSGSGAAVGVLLGGVLTSYLSWSWIFFVNVPVGVAAALLAPVLLRESRAELGHRHVDLAGAATVTGGLMLFVYALTHATTDGWGATPTLLMLAGSAVVLAAFVAIELRSPWPLMPLRIFRLRTLSAANATMTILGAVTFGEFFLLTLYLQGVLGYGALKSGAAFSAFAGSVVVASNLAQRIVARFGVRRTLVAGILLSAVSLAWLTRLPLHGDYAVDLLPAFVAGGFGLGLSFVPVTIAGLQGVTPGDAGIASGLVNTSRQIGGAVGLAAVSAIAALGGGHVQSVHALAGGFRNGLYALTGMLLAAAALAFVFVRQPRPQAEAEPVHEPVVLQEAA
jgi:MFS family permease